MHDNIADAAAPSRPWASISMSQFRRVQLALCWGSWPGGADGERFCAKTIALPGSICLP